MSLKKKAGSGSVFTLLAFSQVLYNSHSETGLARSSQETENAYILYIHRVTSFSYSRKNK